MLKPTEWVELKIQNLELYRYALVASIISFLGALSLVLITQLVWLLVDAETPDNRDIQLTFSDIMGYVIIAPLVETLIIALIVKLNKPMRFSIVAFCFIPAILSAILHALIAPISLLGIMFSFYIFSYSYMSWQKTGNKHKAYWASCLPHMLHNSYVLLLVLLPLE